MALKQIQSLRKAIKVGDKVYIKAGSGSCTAVYNGTVEEVDEFGVWIDEGEEFLDYVSFEDMTEWAVE